VTANVKTLIQKLIVIIFKEFLIQELNNEKNFFFKFLEQRHWNRWLHYENQRRIRVTGSERKLFTVFKGFLSLKIYLSLKSFQMNYHL
jgi:hypothetical protein